MGQGGGGVACCAWSSIHLSHASHPTEPSTSAPPLQVNATKKVVRYRPPEVAAALQRLELAKEHLAVSGWAAGAPGDAVASGQGRAHRPTLPRSLAPHTHWLPHTTLQAACAKAWQQFLSDFASEYVAFRAAAQALAALDCLCGLAVLASSAG